MRQLIIAALLLLPASAIGADTPPMEQALTIKLSQEINDNLNCGAQVIMLQKQLADAQKQIAELTKGQK